MFQGGISFLFARGEAIACSTGGTCCARLCFCRSVCLFSLLSVAREAPLLRSEVVIPSHPSHTVCSLFWFFFFLGRSHGEAARVLPLPPPPAPRARFPARSRCLVLRSCFVYLFTRSIVFVILDVVGKHTLFSFSLLSPPLTLLTLRLSVLSPRCLFPPLARACLPRQAARHEAARGDSAHGLVREGRFPRGQVFPPRLLDPGKFFSNSFGMILGKQARDRQYCTCKVEGDRRQTLSRESVGCARTLACISPVFETM